MSSYVTFLLSDSLTGPPTEMRDSSASDGEIESLCNRVVMEVVGSAQAYAAQREAEKQQEEEIEYLRRLGNHTYVYRVAWRGRMKCR